MSYRKDPMLDMLKAAEVGLAQQERTICNLERDVTKLRRENEELQIAGATKRSDLVHSMTAVVFVPISMVVALAMSVSGPAWLGLLILALVASLIIAVAVQRAAIQELKSVIDRRL